MSLSVLPMFSSKSFIVSGLMFRSLIHFEYGVRKCSNSFSYTQLPSFPASFIEEAVFAPLYILASFVKNKISIGAWVYFWAFYPVPLVQFLFLCQYHTVLMTLALKYNLKSGRLIPPAPFFFLRTALAIQGLLCFHMICEIFFVLVL